MEKLFIRFATATAKLAGRPLTFGACLALVLAWAVSGPVFGFNETWPLVAANAVSLMLAATALVCKWRFRDGDPKGAGRRPH